MRESVSHRPAPTAAAPGGADKSRASNCFDFLRLFAASAVVVQHSVAHLRCGFLWLRDDRSSFLAQDGPWFFDGVELFFILSGYLVYQSCQRCYERGLPVRCFYANRLLRIAPGLYAYALLTTLLLVVTGAITPHSLGSRGFLGWLASNLVLVPVYYPDLFRPIGVGVLNGSLWTIPVECSFYLCVPAVYLFGRRFGFSRMMLAVFAMAFVGSAIHWASQQGHERTTAEKLIGITFLPYLLYFGLGMLWSRAWPHAPRQMVWFLIAVGLYAGLRGDVGSLRQYFGPVWRFAWALPLSYAVLWFGHHGPDALQKLTRIGDLSYGMYIWHMIVVNLFLYEDLVVTIRGHAGPQVVVLAVLIVTAAIATLSWWLVEKPALRLKPFTSQAPGHPAICRTSVLVDRRPSVSCRGHVNATTEESN